MNMARKKSDEPFTMRKRWHVAEMANNFFLHISGIGRGAHSVF